LIELDGKAALVTGGSRGIGSAIAKGLASRGAAVAIGYLSRKTDAEAVVAEITGDGGTAMAVQADLGDPTEVERLFEEAERALGPLDIVFANAADAIVKPLVECSEEDFDAIFAANTKSAFFTMQEAARRIRDGGRIVATSTGGTRMFFTGISLYLGSKGGRRAVSCACFRASLDRAGSPSTPSRPDSPTPSCCRIAIASSRPRHRRSAGSVRRPTSPR
jgi:3-oxoacyl-[acyl-carrier protein] reductase